MNKQHVQLPNDLGDISFIKPKDQLVYVAIKKFMNKDTKEAFPSLGKNNFVPSSNIYSISPVAVFVRLIVFKLK